MLVLSACFYCMRLLILAFLFVNVKQVRVCLKNHFSNLYVSLAEDVVLIQIKSSCKCFRGWSDQSFSKIKIHLSVMME